MEIFFDSLALRQDARAFGNLHITAIGEGTKNALLARACKLILYRIKYVGEELVSGLAYCLTKTVGC